MTFLRTFVQTSSPPRPPLLPPAPIPPPPPPPLPLGRSHDGGTLDSRTRWIRRPSSCWNIIVYIFIYCGSFGPPDSPRHDPLGSH